MESPAAPADGGFWTEAAFRGLAYSDHLPLSGSFYRYLSQVGIELSRIMSSRHIET